MAGVRRGAFTCVGWQVTLGDPIWQVRSHSSEMGFPWRAISAFYPFNFKYGRYIHSVHANTSPLKIWEKMDRGRIQWLPNFLPPIISGTGKATNFKFGSYIQRVHENKSPLKIWEKRERGRIQGLPKFFEYPLLSQERVKLRTSNFVRMFLKDRQKRRGRYSSSWEPHLRATGRHLPYGITQCYLPPDTSERASPNPSHAVWCSIYRPRRDGRLSWPSYLDRAPAGNRSFDHKSDAEPLHHQDNQYRSE